MKIALVLSGVVGLGLSLLDQPFISFEPSPGAIPLHRASIILSPDDHIGVHIAAENLAADFEQIVGTRPPVIAAGDGFDGSTKATQNAVIIASAQSSLLKSLTWRKKTSSAEIEGKWETFQTSILQHPIQGLHSALLIAGSDKRGTIFGVYTFAEQCGQSPMFHYWLDIPAKRHAEIYALPGVKVFGEPTVRHRGLFINDEAPGLTGWWSRKHEVDHYPLDAEFYRHVFDLLLRLKANFIWPAMWASYVPKPGNIFFTDDPQNQQLADDYGIVVSTSHHEPMQRATNEWNTSETGPWDWSANKDNVTSFMEEGVERARSRETYFTLGMRGPNDGPIEGDDPIAILQEVFATEREILGKHYDNATAAKQVWTIYKEVATYYSQGLTPPDDVTLMFTDDNWGNIQRLPTEEELNRSGGFGMYYHFEYVGRPKSYKWHNTNNLAKVLKELSQASNRGVRQIWVMNVGDIKPMELPLALSMDLAWDASAITFDSLPGYLKALVARDFRIKHSEEIAELLLQHSHLIGRRRYESVGPSTYYTLNFREIERVLAEWADLADRTEAIGSSLPNELQAAYFHLVRYPIIAGYRYHAVVLGQGKNLQYGYERRNLANAKATEVMDHFERDYDLTEEYDDISDGKWSGIMSQPKFDMSMMDWRGPSSDVLANLSNAAAPSMDEFAPILPVINRYGPNYRVIEIFHRDDHRVPVNWTLEIPEPWLKIEPASGTVSGDVPQQELHVSIDWPEAPSDFNSTLNVTIRYDTIPYFDIIRIPVDTRSVPLDFTGFPESARIVSIEAPHFQRASSGDVTFEKTPHLGSRSESGSLALRPYVEARSLDTNATLPWVEYDIYLFDAANLTATLYINFALDTDPNLPMAYFLQLNSAPTNWTRLVGDPATAGDLPPGWNEAVADGVWTRNATFRNMPAGKHTLRWSVNSPEVYLEKIVLSTSGSVPESYLGPPETKVVEAV